MALTVNGKRHTEEVVLDPKTCKSRDWDSYQVLRFTELREIKIALNQSRTSRLPARARTR